MDIFQRVLFSLHHFFAIIPSKLGNSINNIQNLVLVVFGLLGGALLMVMGFGLNLIISTFS